MNRFIPHTSKHGNKYDDIGGNKFYSGLFRHDDKKPHTPTLQNSYSQGKNVRK